MQYLKEKTAFIYRADGPHLSRGASSIVGDKGQVFLSGLPEEGLLLVNWGSASCRADYRLDISKNMNGIVMANAVCQ
ncbi:hypothetical protein AAF129_001575 [Salmonella enterica]|nr:hypothetical protein [Salmonella enterica]